MLSGKLMKVIILYSLIFFSTGYSQISKGTLVELRKEYQTLDKIFVKLKSSNSLNDKMVLSKTKFKIDSLKNALLKQRDLYSGLIYHIGPMDLDGNFELLDFNLHDWSEDAYRVTARLRCKTKIYTDFVKLTYQFYKDSAIVGSDYCYIDFVTYGYSGMSPFQTTFISNFVDKYDFDNMLFYISYDNEDGTGDIYWDQVMKLIDVGINQEYNLNHWFGTVENRSNYSFTFPKVFAAIFKNDQMVELDYTYLDLHNAPSDSVIIFSVTTYPTDSEQVSLKNSSNFSADISDWTIGDKNDPIAYKIPNGTTLLPKEIKSFDTNTLNFQIDDEGEIIFLKNEEGISVDKWKDDTTGTFFDVIISSVTTTPTTSEQVTLRNMDNVNADISGWTIGDKNDPIAYNIPNGTILSPGEEKKIVHTQLNFGINDKNEIIYLMNQDSVLIDIWGGRGLLINELEERFLPHTTATFDSYIDLPDEYDKIKYFLNYSLYSLEGSGNIPPNLPLFTDTSYSSLERTTLSTSLFVLDYEKSLINAKVNWGDNSESSWSYPTPSNSEILFNHAYAEAGEYYIFAKAKDDSGGTTEWSDSIKVRISSVENLAIIQKQIRNGIYKKYYSDTLKAVGGVSPYKWQIIDGSLPNGVILNYNSGRIYGSPITSGKFNFIVRVTDNGFPAKTDSDTFSIEIVNNPPIIFSSDSISILEHQQMTYIIRANDPDSNVIFFNFENYPNWVRVIDDSTLFGIPPEGALDTSFLAIATDRELSDSIVVNVIVIPVNDSPNIINIEDFSFKNNENFQIDLDTCVVDPDNDIQTLIWNISSSDSNLIVGINDHIAQFSAPNWSGTAEVKFVVEDSLEGKDSLSVNVTVNYPSQILLQKDNLPETYFLGKIYPNPFNSTLSISFGLPEPANVSITIYNVIGERVAQLVAERKLPGYYKVNWHANDNPSGIYIVKMKAEKYINSQKCLLIK